MNRNTNIEIVGSLGEKIVRSQMEDLGLKVFMSEDKYDRVKDMVVENETVEVKTLTPIKKETAFCMDKSQWKKLDNVDRLFFVEIPDYPNPVVVYEATKKYFFTKPFKGEIARFYPKEHMRKFCVIHDNILESTLRNHSDSKYLIRGENDRAVLS